MRIVQFASAPGEGLCLHASELAMALAARGATVTVVTGPGEQYAGTRDRLAAAGVAVHTIAGLDESGWLRARPRPARALAAVLAAEARHGPLVLHVLTPRQLTLAARARRAVPGGGIATVVMLSSLRNGRWYEGAAYLAGGVMLRRRADAVVAQCEAERRKLAPTVPAARLRVIHAWKDVGAFRARLGGALPPEMRRGAARSIDGPPLDAALPLAVYPAQYRAGKDHALLFRALRLLRDRGVDLTCICPGWGAHRNAIARAAIAGGVGDRVALPGRLHQDLVAPFLAQADLVAVPSRAESFGWVMVEPMILGLPLVATRVGIAHELEREGAAGIVAPGDAPAFAAALERVLRDSAAARARAERGRAYVERACDLPRVVDALLGVYESVLRPRAARPASAVPLPAA